MSEVKVYAICELEYIMKMMKIISSIPTQEEKNKLQFNTKNSSNGTVQVLGKCTKQFQSHHSQ